jgi:hypothetical protein
MTPSEILQKHEDANEMHLHHIDKKWVVEAMEEYSNTCNQRLETLAKLLAKSWFYGQWEWENPNERIQQMIMQDLGYYPFKDEDEMIIKTRVDEDLYKEAVDKVALRNPRITPVECHNSSNICDKQQTAVEWFWNEIAEVLPFTVDSVTAIKMYEKLQQAKAMEKEQIIDAHIEGQRVFDKHPHTQWTTDQSEQYYTETYGDKQ